ncbi:MAG: universal stress protein [Verrucomicrobiota bacterium]
MKKILVCTDGSQYAREACRYAAWLSQRTGARVEALYVSSLWEYELPFLMDLGGSLGASPYSGLTGQLEEVEKAKADLVEKAVRHELSANQVAVDDDTFHHETGLLVDALDAFETGEQAADVIILGKRGEGAEQAKEHLGGNLERVVRASRQPCLVTNREYREIKTIALAYDGSASTQKALDWIFANKAFHELSINVLTVDDARGDHDHSRIMQIAETRLREASLKADCHLLSGDVEDEIARFVDDHAVDLLVMGAYGHSRIRELLIGSTTTDLIRRCKIPILLFR